MNQEQLLAKTDHPRYFLATGENKRHCQFRARQALDACLAAGERFGAPVVELIEITGAMALYAELELGVAIVEID